MNEGDTSARSWWQTLPGILTAIAGLITAVAGLLVALHQIGLLGNKEKSAQSPPAYNDTAKQAEATALNTTPAPSKDAKILANEHARSYSVSFPSGTEVTLHSNRADGTYKILVAQLDNKNTGKLILKISVRLTNLGRSDLGFWSDSFRLIIDGVPRAPINSLNALVEARSAKEGEVVFEVPDTATNLVLSVANGEDTGNLPVVLKKPG